MLRDAGQVWLIIFTKGRGRPSRLTLVTGPSRTGDIELTMTTGVHGPGKVLHFILDRVDPEAPHADD